MTGAMSKNKKTGFVEYDKERCASCYMCIMACPYGVLKSDRLKHKEIMKCDMCTSCSEKDGSKPMCVEKCPMGAITLGEVNKMKYVVLGASAAGVNGVRQISNFRQQCSNHFNI